MRIKPEDIPGFNSWSMKEGTRQNVEKCVALLLREITDIIFVTGPHAAGKTMLVQSSLARLTDRRTEVEWIDLSSSSNPISDVTAVMEQYRNADRARDRRDSLPERLIVVLDGAEGLRGKPLHEIVYSWLGWERVRKVIVTTQYRDQLLGGAEEIHLSLPEGRLYALKEQVFVPQEEIILTVAPQIITANDALVRKLKKKPLDLFNITSRQFEEVIAELLKGMGMEVELTPATRDGGKDILAYMNTPVGKLLTLVEAKQHNKNRPVGVSLVRTLFGTLVDHKATTGMLVTTSRFAKPAKEFQERHKYQLELKDYGDVVGWLMKYKT